MNAINWLYKLILHLYLQKHQYKYCNHNPFDWKANPLRNLNVFSFPFENIVKNRVPSIIAINFWYICTNIMCHIFWYFYYSPRSHSPIRGKVSAAFQRLSSFVAVASQPFWQLTLSELVTPYSAPGTTRDAAAGSSNVEASRAMWIQCTERNSPLGDVIAHVAH